MNDDDSRVPEKLRVVDAHVHAFPERLEAAVRKWFERHAWRVDDSNFVAGLAAVDALLSRGVARVWALPYSHAEGVAAALNDFTLALARDRPGRVAPFCTVLPGEPDARRILERAFDAGARGVKLHCHVQRVAADDPRLDDAYALCAERGAPCVVHAGREPHAEGYGVDTRALCDVAQLGRVLARHPKLTLVLPHLGYDQQDESFALLGDYPGLYLDTTMALAGFLTPPPPPEVLARHASRLLYGSDFPRLPYAWDVELRKLVAAGLPPEALELILHGNADRLVPA